MRILIVDDEAGVREVCGRALSLEGHEVSDCESGEAASFRLGERWDLILTDLAMPGRVDGNDLVRLARAAGQTPIALMSANPSVLSTIAALRDGACDYLVKPFPLSALVDLVRRRAGGRPAEAAPIEPRRQSRATILFADVRGFTSFSERVSSEEAASRLDELLACFIEAVHAEGGTINKFIGDGAMAVFGVPLPHAEPAAAAARAALRARAAVERLSRRFPDGEALRFGFGINTGLVAAGLLGTKDSSEYGVIGSPVNLAARLEEAAGPGEILVGSETSALLDGRFVLRAEREFGLAGIRAAVRAAELASLAA